jgi:hypothetical protein
MSREPALPVDSLTPAEPLPCCADAFTRKMTGLLDGQPKDEAAVERAFEGMEPMLDQIAAKLYSLASMLVGEGEESALLVETAISTADVASCSNSGEARQSGRRALAAAALGMIEERSPGSLAAPVGLEHAATCIEDDDLDAAGMPHEELERMMAGPDRERVRTWLESLPTEMRTVFVLRAVAGFSAAETAALLAAHGGSAAAGWTADAVRELFRQGLCSLASQLIQASVGQ